MASRTRVPTKTIEDILAGTIDVIDRADRLLGKVDLIRYMGTLCGPANPIDTQTIVGGVPVDPRARTWVLNQLTDSVQVAPLLGGVWDVSDRWARQLGQIDLALYRGLACGAVNPLDIQIIVGGVVIDPRQIRALVAADTVTVNNLLNPHPISGSVTANAGLNLNTSLLALEAGGNLATIAGKDFATQTTLALINAKLVSGTDIGDVTINNGAGAAAVNVQDGGNVLTVDGTLTQSTKHDATTYKNAYVKLTADGNIIAGVANKLLYVHWVKVVMGADTEGEVYDKSGGSIIDHLPHNDREGFVSGFVPYPAAVWKSQISEELYFDLTSATGEAYFTIVYSEQDT